MNLLAVDQLDVQILVDNTTDMLSSNAQGAQSEAAGLFARGGRMMGGLCLCCAVHGLSCLITATVNGERKSVLFDTGPEEFAFERNVSRLGADLSHVSDIVLSHGHWDHAGAMLLALNMIRTRGGADKIHFYGHPDMFHKRAVSLPGGIYREMMDVPSVAQLESFGAEVHLTREAITIASDLFMVSGEIPRVTSFERGFPGQVRLNEMGQWETDEVMVDERWLGVHVKGKGLVVFSACSHAGIVNVLTDARSRFPGVPLHAVFGGFHLSGPNEAIIDQTVEGLKPFGLELIGAGHCTGWRAIAALSHAFGDQVLVPTAVGKRYTF
jgi:7,8-dihydropterin-6-yl-methyl-4-(beta-D-ribofuranosyl)aminobenzene 5'-phosphate synthase